MSDDKSLSMPDLFGHEAETLSPPPPEKLQAPMPLKREAVILHVTLVVAAAAFMVWGTWVSKSLHDLRSQSTHIVKVRLSELVGEYVQTTARSGMPTDQAAQQTGVFLKVLNDTVLAHGSKGEVVMLANAIVGGDVPDITDQVRADVYGKVGRPQSASSNNVQTQMKQFMDANSAAAPEASSGQ